MRGSTVSSVAKQGKRDTCALPNISLLEKEAGRCRRSTHRRSNVLDFEDDLDYRRIGKLNLTLTHPIRSSAKHSDDAPYQRKPDACPHLWDQLQH